MNEEAKANLAGWFDTLIRMDQFVQDSCLDA